MQQSSLAVGELAQQALVLKNLIGQMKQDDAEGARPRALASAAR